jgi:mannose-6-phosphate isomerase-like protein (cupin superfamily)
MSYQGNIIEKTEANDNFREVVYTGPKSQLVVMAIPPGGDIGMETHPHVEQILFFHSGKGEASLDGVVTEFGPGDVVVVAPGVEHNFTNTGEEPLKVYTVYSPPNHIDGRVHATQADAEADQEDEDFGHAIVA